MKKIKTFEEVRAYLDSVSMINCGGCGVSAYAMYKWLCKNNQLDDEFRFVCCYRTEQDDCYINNVQVLRSGKGEAIACSHIGIYNGDQAIDSDSVIRLHTYGYIHYVSADWFIRNMINNRGTWNAWFDRENIPVIARDLDIDLSDLTI